MQENVQVILLAGGKSRRMKSGYSKVLQDISGKSIISWDFLLLEKLGLVSNTTVVLSFDNEKVKKEIEQYGFRPKFIDQGIPLGTAHAVKKGLDNDYKKEITLVLYGDDAALYNPYTIESFLKFHKDSGDVISLLTVKQDKINYLGFLKKDSSGNIVGIDSTHEGVNLLEKETVCGAFCFNTEWLRENIVKIKKNDSNGEYPLPALIYLAADENKFAHSFILKNEFEWTSVNTPEELERARIYKNILQK